MKNKTASIIASMAIVATLLVTNNALAATLTSQHNRLSKKTQSVPHVVGTVATIDGSSFTISIHGHGKNSQPTIFTINTTDSTIYTKNGQSDSLSDLAVGQRVVVSGTIDETNKSVAATKVNIFIPVPRALGIVQSISGNTIIITGRHNITDTIDATNTKISEHLGKKTQTISISDITVGERILVAGTIGTPVHATTFPASTILVLKK